jgi:hypothetical protein
MQDLQEQKPVIAMDGMYAGFAGAKASRKKTPLEALIGTIKV